ncbi:hypothetical protein [Vreelandella sp. V005]|uniref:hypothetical protein n=1 Tax=Vreelandella sp. V005 TaxID=3459608 RepID=UPI004043CC71
MGSQDEHHVVDWIPGNKLRDTTPDLLIIFVLFVTIAASIFLQFAHPETNWFMRSGALMVLTGAILEYRNSALMRRLDITSTKWASCIGSPAIFEPRPLKKKIVFAAHAFVVFGTLIAAYGDLIFTFAMKLSI